MANNTCIRAKIKEATQSNIKYKKILPFNGLPTDRINMKVVSQDISGNERDRYNNHIDRQNKPSRDEFIGIF